MFLEGSLDVTRTDSAVEFIFVVTNEGPEAVNLEFRSGQVAEIVVTENNDEIWRWSNSRMFTQTIHHKPLAPGDSMDHKSRWEDPTSGRYMAKASLEAVNVCLVEQAEFEV